MPTNERDFFLQGDWSFLPGKNLILRYQATNLQTYIADLQNAVEQVRYKFRFQLDNRFGKKLQVRSRVEKVFLTYSFLFPDKQGINIYQDIKYQFSPFFSVQTRFSTFSTVDFDARIYEYENDIPGTFSTYPLYGKGNKWYLLLKYTPAEYLKIWFKYRRLYFDGVETIGSGDLEIKGDTRNDIRIQVDLQL